LPATQDQRCCWCCCLTQCLAQHCTTCGSGLSLHQPATAEQALEGTQHMSVFKCCCHLLPRYLELELSRHVLRNIARFRLRALTLRVETGCWQIHNRFCDKCDLHDIQDEKHVLFLCPCLEMCYLRGRFEEQFADCTGRTYIGDTGAFYFDNIGAEDVKLFFLKQTYKLFLFLSETMDTFCLAGSVQQAQQSTHLAEGLNPL